jgi:hypothetical protein
MGLRKQRTRHYIRSSCSPLPPVLQFCPTCIYVKVLKNET